MSPSKVCVLGILCLVACEKSAATTTAPSAASVTAEPPPPVVKEPTPLEVILETKDLNKALAVMKPLFKDVGPDEPPDENARSFAIWADSNLTWKDLGTLPFVKPANVKKDPDLERAKYFCLVGRIVQIARVPGKYPIYTGVMGGSTRDDDVVNFLAVHSTGDLVEKSKSKFCGIVTGKRTYKNSGGGSTHAIHLVGMFDLPENKTFGVSPPAATATATATKP